MEEVLGIANQMQATDQAMQQMAMSASLAKKSAEFQGSMVNAIISGGTDAARNAGLAAQGIGTKINIAV